MAHGAQGEDEQINPWKSRERHRMDRADGLKRFQWIIVPLRGTGALCLGISWNLGTSGARSGLDSQVPGVNR